MMRPTRVRDAYEEMARLDVGPTTVRWQAQGELTSGAGAAGVSFDMCYINRGNLKKNTSRYDKK